MKKVEKLTFARALLLVLLLSGTQHAVCQNVLSRACNLFQVGDSVTKQKVEYVYAGDDGDDVVWDFSDLEQEDTYYIKYDTLSSELYVGRDTQKTYKFLADSDSLLFLGFETPLLGMDYQKPQLTLPFPLQLNQTFSSDYQGEGRYCGTHFERTFGSIRIAADGQGTLILSENDTLPNTLRVYTITTEAIRLNVDSCRNDSDNLKQVITERYQWFTRGYRYPVLETVTSSTYDNLNHVATQQYAYCCPPDVQYELCDSINERIREEDLAAARNGNENSNNSSNNGHTAENEDDKNGNGVGFSYDVECNGNQVTITYDLEKDAHIHAMVVDVMGMLYRDVQQSNGAGTGYTMKIDCNGLRPGQYIIYINVNGTIHSTKIPVK